MATVYLYTRINDRKQYAAKVVERASLTHEREFTNELEILAYLKGHDHILEVEVHCFCLLGVGRDSVLLLINISQAAV